MLMSLYTSRWNSLKLGCLLRIHGTQVLLRLWQPPRYVPADSLCNYYPATKFQLMSLVCELAHRNTR